MKNTYLVLLVLVLVGAGAYFMMPKGSSPVVEEKMESTSQKVGENVTTGASGVTMDTSDVKEFTLTASEFKFDVTTITVKKGDTVKLTLANSGKYTHDWVVDEFNAATKQIKAGETDTITFVADKAGTFEYYCSVMEHRKQGQVGKLIVTE